MNSGFITIFSRLRVYLKLVQFNFEIKFNKTSQCMLTEVLLFEFPVKLDRIKIKMKNYVPGWESNRSLLHDEEACGQPH